jgi:type I restriction enzyme S subunit
MLDQAKNEGERTFYLRNVNVRWFRFDLSDLAMMKANDSDRIKFDVKNGDLFVCEGGEPGRAAVWDNGENELIFQKALHRIRFNSDVNPYWFLYNLNSASISGVLKTLFTGTGIMHLTLKSLSKFEVPIPKLEEQKEIVRIVEYLFSIADAIESQYHVLKQKIDNLPQALLAKAFRGELVPQDPDDEPAAVLLEKIRNEMGKLGKKGKKQGVFDLVEG